MQGSGKLSAPVGIEGHATVDGVLAKEAAVLLGARPGDDAESKLLVRGDNDVAAPHVARLSDKGADNSVEPVGLMPPLPLLPCLSDPNTEQRLHATKAYSSQNRTVQSSIASV